MDKVLTLDTINPNVIKIEYAVRGPIVERAIQIEKELEKGQSKTFTEVVKCNIGDCHATGQKAITFLRQVTVLTVCPHLLEDKSFPEDAKSRAANILSACAGSSIGSYSHSLGLEMVRRDVAKYIHHRDGIESNWVNIFLSTGATEAVKMLLELLSTTGQGSERAGVMIPVPQYPLYSATNAEYNNFQINYYLNENDNWSLSADELNRALSSVKGQCIPKAIVVINPGNPTGQVLPRRCMKDIIKFAVDNRLMIIADEVYQHNVYQPDKYPWVSFKKVVFEMGPGYSDKLELASLMSCSKGYMGECGYRGGYCELLNFDPAVQAQLYKALSARLCPPLMGQVALEAIVNPPQSNEPSYSLFVQERDNVLSALKEKADITYNALNSMPNMSCNPVQGAMYAFPRIYLPPAAIQEAEKRGEKPDFFYCLQLLEEKGICVVPGSGFGQEEGTYHFRTTILPSVEKMKYVMQQIKEFHISFIKKYS
ncbi:Alanine aminotransferase 2 [Schistosoma japonicum]|nr:Alanine aminotransferase 2 [Schistosoma japonicum]